MPATDASASSVTVVPAEMTMLSPVTGAVPPQVASSDHAPLRLDLFVTAASDEPTVVSKAAITAVVTTRALRRSHRALPCARLVGRNSMPILLDQMFLRWSSVGGSSLYIAFCTASTPSSERRPL